MSIEISRVLKDMVLGMSELHTSNFFQLLQTITLRLFPQVMTLGDECCGSCGYEDAEALRRVMSNETRFTRVNRSGRSEQPEIT